jgi:hypothetical protein
MTSENRANQLISKAINMSPIARRNHDAYYPKGFFRYKKIAEAGGNYAYIKKSDDTSKTSYDLCFRTVHSDSILIDAVQHELAHINHHGQAKINNIPTEAYDMTYDSYMARVLIWEAQAFANSAEGPVIGLLESLKENRTDDVDSYRSLFNELKSENTHSYDNKKAFIKSLFQKDPVMPDLADSIIYEYFNGYSLLDEKTIEQRVKEARKSLVKRFFSLEGLKNNWLLDYYIKDASIYYKNSKPQMNDILIQYNDMISMLTGEKKSNMSRPEKDQGSNVDLDKILKTTDHKDQIYLSKADWHEALQAKTATELVNRSLFFSKYKNDPSIPNLRSGKFTP